MKFFRNGFCLMVAASIGLSWVQAAELSNAAAPAKLTREDLREQLKGLSPAEREVKLKELRQKYNVINTNRAIMDQRREELKNLSPEERAAKIREWRAGTNAVAKGPSPEERQAKLNVIRARLKQQAEVLRQKKAEKTITPEEEKRLERMEEMIKRFEKDGAVRPAPAPAPEKPAGDK